jgi:hypothetical protein
MIVKLIPKTPKALSIVRQHGELFNVIDEDIDSEQHKVLMIESHFPTMKWPFGGMRKYWTWLSTNGDENFDHEIIQS